MLNQIHLNFSFSGLKTAFTFYLSQKFSKVELDKELSNIAASYQECIIDTLLKKLSSVIDIHHVDNILIAGGVSANKRFRLKSSILEKKKY